MIFANGDSFTYGDELDNPHSEAWPYVLSQMLSLDVVNFGENGKDNAGIIETTKKYHDRIIDYGQHSTPAPRGQTSKGQPIWRSYSRKVDHVRQRKLLPKIWIIQWTTFRRFHDNPPIDVVLKKLDKQYLLDLYFIQVKDLQEWFEWHGFSYLMFNGFDNEKYIRDNDSEFKALVDDKYFIGWPDESVVNWVYDYEHGPRGHPRAAGHNRIAGILYENIRSKLRFP